MRIVDRTTMKQKLKDLLVAISWADLSRTYFGKSNSWLYHKMDGRDGNGKPTEFTEEETEQLRNQRKMRRFAHNSLQINAF